MTEGNRLLDKVAIVTGAGTRGPLPGIGQASSILFARHGAKVLLVDLDVQRAEITLAAIEQEGGQASVFQADVTNEDDCRAMAEACFERYGALHILLNNVGTHGPGMVTEIEEPDWDRTLDVNLKSMAMHHGRDNTRVNCIAPGHVHASFVSDLPDEMRELRRKAGPLGTEGTAWDVGWAAVFLASDEARSISGVVLHDSERNDFEGQDAEYHLFKQGTGAEWGPLQSSSRQPHGYTISRERCRRATGIVTAQCTRRCRPISTSPRGS